MWTRVYENVKLMLQRRGYDDIKETHYTPSSSEHVTYEKPILYAGNGKIKVLFIEALSTAGCSETVKVMRDEKIPHLIYVASNIPARLNQDMDQLSLHTASKGFRFEVFETSFFLFDKLQTDLLKRCYPEPMSLKESQKWLVLHKIQPQQLKQYVPRDFVVRYFGLVPGQIVRIRGLVDKYRIYWRSSTDLSDSHPTTAE